MVTIIKQLQHQAEDLEALVAERNRELHEEMQRADELLQEVLPL